MRLSFGSESGSERPPGFWQTPHFGIAYSGDRDRSFRLNVTVAHEMVLRD
jgi:hypothetical protein